MNRNGGNAIAIKADVSNEEEVQSMFQQMYDKYGTIDILVNNAGIQKDSAFHEMSLAGLATGNKCKSYRTVSLLRVKP